MPPGGGGFGGPPPSSNLVWAILATIFCCLPFGIVSIVYAAGVNSKWTAGDYQGAQDASSKARTWAIAAAISGVVLIVLWVIIDVAVLRNATTTGG